MAMKSKHPGLLGKAADSHANLVKLMGKTKNDIDVNMKAKQRKVKAEMTALERITGELGGLIESYVGCCKKLVEIEAKLNESPDKDEKKKLERDWKTYENNCKAIRGTYNKTDTALEARRMAVIGITE